MNKKGRFRAVVSRGDGALHYRIRSGKLRSAIHRVKPWPTDELSIAVTANWLRNQDLAAIIQDAPDLLVSAGDHIEDLVDNPDAFRTFIDTYPEVFATIPFLPVLGNHDRQIRPRGKAPAPDPVYDIEASAYTRHFALPGDEWKWKLDFKDFDFRIIALDLNHTSDVGTNWQSCHDFHADSEQFRWYEKVTRTNPPLTITVQNEQNSRVRRFAGGIWEKPLRRGVLCIAGFGYFAERAEPEGFTCYNVSLNGTGNQYPDPASAFIASENNYILLTVPGSPGPMKAEIKSLSGKVLDHKEIQRKERN